SSGSRLKPSARGVMSSVSPAPNCMKISRNSCTLWPLLEAIRIECADMEKAVYVTTSEDAGRRLDDVLVTWLTETLKRRVSKAKAPKLIMAGTVYCNARRTRIASLVLAAGAKIEAHIELAKLFSDSTSRDKAFELTADRILFEDEDLIAV